ncbi:MAG: hypothetical protein AUI47_03665 [Acidobacteria bacterium 13_1_40CM_2_68_5]|nr:MAG: hypothetical protein AUI47_03665 [Acidobacteria bacterium 13_1_40CM_2_68_5]
MSRRPAVTLTSCIIVLAAGIAAGCGAPSAERATGDVAKAVEASLAGGTERFDHAAWGALLERGTRGGLVDYRYMQEHHAALDSYLNGVAAARLDRLAATQLEALLIDAYNAYTVQSILDHPDVSSIRMIPGVWTETRHRVGGFDLTLDDIEHRLLRPFFRDPRLHFALNCASRSCAPLPPWAYDGNRIEEQLEERARSFLSDQKNVRIEGARLLVSKYFDWYGGDFTAPGWKKAAPSIGSFIAGYAAPDPKAFIERQGGKPPIVFMEYDWSLNTVASSVSHQARDEQKLGAGLLDLGRLLRVDQLSRRVERLARADDLHGRGQDENTEGRQHLAQHQDAAHGAIRARGGAHEERDLPLERVAGRSRGPVDDVLERPRDRVVVLRRADEEGVGGDDPLLELARPFRQPLVCLDVAVVRRHRHIAQVEQVDVGLAAQRLDGHRQELTVEGAGTQGAGEG